MLNFKHPRILFTTGFILFFSFSAYADKGQVVEQDVCGSGNAVIETTDGWYIAAEHQSGVYLNEGDIVFGNLKTFGFEVITRDDGSDGQFYIEDYEVGFEAALEELCE